MLSWHHGVTRPKERKRTALDGMQLQQLRLSHPVLTSLCPVGTELASCLSMLHPQTEAKEKLRACDVSTVPTS